MAGGSAAVRLRRSRRRRMTEMGFILILVKGDNSDGCALLVFQR